MPRFNRLLALATVCLTASSTPLEQLAARGSFSLQQVAVESEQTTLEEIVARHYWKYGFDAPKPIERLIQNYRADGGVSRVAEPGGGSGTVTALPVDGDKMYLIDTQVGRHKMRLDLDTGSADLWVLSTDLEPSYRVKFSASRLYDTKAANKVKGSNWQIRYGSGERVSGGVYTDKVRIGGLEVSKQAVQAAVTLAGRGVAQNKFMDGILGMGFSGLNQVRPKKVLTWFDNIRGKLDQPLFVSNLKRNAPGSFDFGFLDKKKYVGDIAWVHVNSSKGFWDFKVEGFGVGSGTVKRTNTYNIVDTGSSLWFMPEELVREYYAKVPGAQAPPRSAASNIPGVVAGYTFPCNTTLPDITLVVGGKRVSVPGKNMNYQTASRALNKCFGGLQVRAPYMPFNLFGDTFLKGMYVVFEHKPGGQPRIGVARGVS